MTSLTIYNEKAVSLSSNLNNYQDIVSKLEQIGVKLEGWSTNIALGKNATSEEILTAYQSDVDKIKENYGFQSVDVISVSPNHPQKKELRQKFLAEHTHRDFEIRFFIEGKALFYLHIDDRVYLVLCEAGDLISVPANTPHWFDMGENPDFRAIRFFTNEEGWIPNFTGNAIASQFPTFDQYLGSLS